MHEEEKLYELKEKLMKELSDYSENGKFSKEDAESIKYIASAIDHICNIVERMEEEEGYSQRDGGGRYSYNGGSYRYSREGGNGGNQGGGGSSYRGGQGGGRYSRNYGGGSSYARGRGRNARRDSMGRYSGAAEPEELVEQIEELMQDAPNEQIKQQMQQLVQQLEQM